MTVKIVVFSKVAYCSLVHIDRRFGGAPVKMAVNMCQIIRCYNLEDNHVQSITPLDDLYF
jgi:hypothetical protein